MKRFAMAIALVCVLSGSVLAGDIHSVGAPAPAPGETQTPPEGGNTQGTGLALLILDLLF